MAPCERTPRSSCHCRGVNRAGRPGLARRFSAAERLGFSLSRLAHWLTADAADIQSTSDLGLRVPAGAEQPARFEPAFFELFWSEFSWSPHAYHRKAGREFVKRLTQDSVDDPEQQRELASAAVAEKLTRSEVVEAVKAVRARRPAPEARPEPVEVEVEPGVTVVVRYRKPSSLTAVHALRKALKMLQERDRTGDQAA